MSALAGVYFWDERPVRASDLDVFATMQHASGPDGGGTVVPAPGLAMQVQLLHFDRWSVLERQPYAFDSGSVLCLDGRIDNRDDLRLRLQRDLSGVEPTDVSLVAAAYRKWGLETTLRTLIGDWSFALWDAAERRVVLARDSMGNRPLYYRGLGNGLAWATHLEALATWAGVLTAPDDHYICGFLTKGTLPDQTPLDGIRRLRAGHALVASPSTHTLVRRYWTYYPSTVRYRDRRQYAEHFRSLLTEGVRVRLRARGTVWAHLSGGWDSSSVVCLAHRLIQQGETEATAIQPLYLRSARSPESDDTHYVRAVERWCGLRCNYYECPSHPPFARLLGLNMLEPINPMWHAPDPPVSEGGGRIVLTGYLGDTISLRDARIALLEPLYEGHLLPSLRLCLARARSKRLPVLFTLASLLTSAYVPVPSGSIRIYVRHSIRSRGQYLRRIASDYGVPLAVAARAPHLVPDHPDVSEFPFVKRGMVADYYRSADDTFFQADKVPEVWRSHPYTHRPLLEFVLAAPSLEFWAPDAHRRGVQLALAEVLPPEILSRTTKQDFMPVAVRMERDWASDLLATAPFQPQAVDSWEIVKRGYVEHQALKTTFSLGQTLNRRVKRHITAWIYLEAWLRTLAGRVEDERPPMRADSLQLVESRQSTADLPAPG